MGKATEQNELEFIRVAETAIRIFFIVIKYNGYLLGVNNDF